jgi:hypothetical protein
MSLILLALAAAASAASDSDPLARARAGEVQCFHPDVLFKTCLSVERYEPAGTGYVNRGANVVVTDDLYVIETEVPVEVRGSAVCATMQPAHVMAGKVTLHGQPAPADKAAAVATELKKKLTGVLGKEICSTYEANDGGGFMATMKMSGKPPMSAPFLWVKPSEGYKAGP